MKRNEQRRRPARRVIALILVLVSLLAYIPAAFALPDLTQYSGSFVRQSTFSGASGQAYAEVLSGLGLFIGSDKGFELERTPNRMEALVSVIRLMGVEDEALELELDSSFSDIPAWAASYAGYGERYGIVQGMGGDTFGAAETVTAVQLLTMMLRVLGYDDKNGDFAYWEAIRFAEELGIIDEWELQYYEEGGGFTRGDMCYILYRTLYSKHTDGETLILHLLDTGAIERAAAANTLQSQGESEREIRRAVANGFSEVWLKNLHTAIEENENIPAQVKLLFKQSVYNWLKEPGMDAAIKQMEEKLANLIVTEKARSEDYYFSSGYAVAYFMSPNIIVLRNDMDLTSFASTVAHELRHAMTASLYPTLLEEGFTELWSQEVDDGDYSYPYHYVNTAKLLTHLAGAEAANRADLTGSWEHMFYAIEKNTGVSFDKDTLYSGLLSLSDPALDKLAAEALNKQLFSIIKGYYSGKLEEILREAGNWQRAADEVIILGQLMYYPSAVIQQAESDLVYGEPKDYYTAEFINWAKETLEALAGAAGVPGSTLSAYWAENYNTRLYLEYFGQRAGAVFAGGNDAYLVYYSFDGYTLAKLYGDADKAERFRRLVRADTVTAIPGAGFSERVYN